MLQTIGLHNPVHFHASLVLAAGEGVVLGQITYMYVNKRMHEYSSFSHSEYSSGSHIATICISHIGKICPIHSDVRFVFPLSSAAHLEPVFMYKGEVCTGEFVFIQAKGYVKVGAVNNCWEDQQGHKPLSNEIPSPSESH